MKNMDIGEFIDGMFYNAEYEITFRNSHFLISCFLENELYCVRMDSIESNSKCLFFIESNDRCKCVSQFEEAKIFDGKTIYEVEQDIEVLYG